MAHLMHRLVYELDPHERLARRATPQTEDERAVGRRVVGLIGQLPVELEHASQIGDVRVMTGEHVDAIAHRQHRSTDRRGRRRPRLLLGARQGVEYHGKQRRAVGRREIRRAIEQVPSCIAGFKQERPVLFVANPSPRHVVVGQALPILQQEDFRGRRGTAQRAAQRHAAAVALHAQPGRLVFELASALRTARRTPSVVEHFAHAGERRGIALVEPGNAVGCEPRLDRAARRPRIQRAIARGHRREDRVIGREIRLVRRTHLASRRHALQQRVARLARALVDVRPSVHRARCGASVVGQHTTCAQPVAIVATHALGQRATARRQVAGRHGPARPGIRRQFVQRRMRVRWRAHAVPAHDHRRDQGPVGGHAVDARGRLRRLRRARRGRRGRRASTQYAGHGKRRRASPPSHAASPRSNVLRGQQRRQARSHGERGDAGANGSTGHHAEHGKCHGQVGVTETAGDAGRRRETASTSILPCASDIPKTRRRQGANASRGAHRRVHACTAPDTPVIAQLMQLMQLMRHMRLMRLARQPSVRDRSRRSATTIGVPRPRAPARVRRRTPYQSCPPTP